MIERCTNCHTAIGNFETPFVWRDVVVCETCYLKLKGLASSPPTESRWANNTMSADPTRLKPEVSLNDLKEAVDMTKSRLEPGLSLNAPKKAVTSVQSPSPRTAPLPALPLRPRPASQPFTIIGRVLCILGLLAGIGATGLGLLLLIYYAFIFDISVSTWDGRVVNTGLMQDRMVRMILGGLFFVAGIIIASVSFVGLLMTGRKREPS